MTAVPHKTAITTLVQYEVPALLILVLVMRLRTAFINGHFFTYRNLQKLQKCIPRKRASRAPLSPFQLRVSESVSLIAIPLVSIYRAVHVMDGREKEVRSLPVPSGCVARRDSTCTWARSLHFTALLSASPSY